MTDQSSSEWLTAVQTELGLEGALDSDQGLDSVTTLARRVGERVDGDVAAHTAFLVGIAAGRADDPSVAAHDITEKLTAMVEGWSASDTR